MHHPLKLLLVCICVFSCLAARLKAANAAEELLPAPEFSLQEVKQEKTYALADYRGKQAILLFFWTTWCPFCRTQLNALNTKYRKLKEEGLEVLAINVDEPAPSVREFLENYHLPYPVVLDNDGRVADAYDIVGVPTYILVNKQGLVVFKNHYFPEDKYKELILD